jgi:putative ABC transport system substrate-binding protein
MYPLRQYADAEGLMSYGANLPDAFRECGTYVGRILRGTKPADLPVLQPSAECQNDAFDPFQTSWPRWMPT